MTFLSDFLNRVGLRVENAEPPPGIRRIGTSDKVAAIFLANSERQRTEYEIARSGGYGGALPTNNRQLGRDRNEGLGRMLDRWLRD